jgi:hypothetical protein
MMQTMQNSLPLIRRLPEHEPVHYIHAIAPTPGGLATAIGMPVAYSAMSRSHCGSLASILFKAKWR